jgi:5-methylcytosine-specific restriction enzyme subunit McrC
MNNANEQLVYWTEHGIPIRNLWHMLLYAWDEVPLSNTAFLADVENAPTLDALFASLLIKLTQQRLRIGMGRDYQNKNHLLHGIRGRINFTESLKQNAFEHGQAYCDFQEYGVNVPKNQILRSTLDRLVHTGDFGPKKASADDLRHNLRRTTRLLDGVDLIELDLDLIHRQQAQRHDRDYRLMLAICELITQRQMPLHAEESRSLPSVRNESLILYRTYERFVANFYRIHLRNWEVTAQKLIHWHEKNEAKYLPSMKPDLFLKEKSSGRIVILDTKFTAQSLVQTPWGTTGFDSSHLYQLYTYIKTQEHLSEGHARARGILLYPAVGDLNLAESIELQGHVLSVETIDLRKPWQEIESNLLNIILGDV